MSKHFMVHYGLNNKIKLPFDAQYKTHTYFTYLLSSLEDWPWS